MLSTYALIKCMARVKVISEINGGRNAKSSSKLVIINWNKYINGKYIPNLF
jgi:hypothetical protein